MNGRRRSSALLELLDIEFDQITPTRVSGSVAADERHHQPWGVVHGGLYTAVIETFATTGAFEAVRDRGQQAVGVSNARTSCGPTAPARCRFSRSRSSREEPNSSGRSRSAARTVRS